MSERSQILTAFREEIRQMFGSRSPLLENTIIVVGFSRRGDWGAIIEECVRLTRLYIHRERAGEVRARLEAIVARYTSQEAAS